MPLYYNISSYRQLSGCKSNNSKHLNIELTDFINNDDIQGLRIAVVDDRYGTLFATVVQSRGNLVNGPNTCSNSTISSDLSRDTILSELEKFGFYISYNPKALLEGKQIEALMTLQSFGFDKLRILQVKRPAGINVDYTPVSYVVGFNVADHITWLNNTYVATEREFNEALVKGTAINISSIGNMRSLNWSWLTYVADISDVIADNAEMRLW